MKKWRWCMPVLPFLFSLMAACTVSIEGMPFLVATNTAILWLLMGVFVFPVGIPILQSKLSKIQWWHIPLLICSNALGCFAYCPVYYLLTGQRDSEGDLLAVLAPVAAGVMTLLTCIAIWYLSDRKEKHGA